MKEIDWQGVQSQLVKEANEYEIQMSRTTTDENRLAFLAAILVLRGQARALQYGLNAPRVRRTRQAINDQFG